MKGVSLWCKSTSLTAHQQERHEALGKSTVQTPAALIDNTLQNVTAGITKQDACREKGVNRNKRGLFRSFFGVFAYKTDRQTKPAGNRLLHISAQSRALLTSGIIIVARLFTPSLRPLLAF